MNRSIVYCIIIYTSNLLQVAFASPNTVYFYASQSDEATLDQGEGGGNPFASAFVEALSSKNLSFSDFQEKIIKLTRIKSNSFQEPEIIPKENITEWMLSPKEKNEKRVALVFVFSNYVKTNLSSLPGAKNDLIRITKSLKKENFEVFSHTDPNGK